MLRSIMLSVDLLLLQRCAVARREEQAMVKKGAPSLATQLAVSGALISSALLAMELRFYMEDQELDEWRAGSAGGCLLACSDVV